RGDLPHSRQGGLRPCRAHRVGPACQPREELEHDMSEDTTPVTYTPASSPCPTCGEPIAPDANFCESCGTQLGDVTEADAQADARAAQPSPDSGVLPISLPTFMLADNASAPPRRTCTECGGTIGPDLYCE